MGSYFGESRREWMYFHVEEKWIIEKPEGILRKTIYKMNPNDLHFHVFMSLCILCIHLSLSVDLT